MYFREDFYHYNNSFHCNDCITSPCRIRDIESKEMEIEPKYAFNYSRVKYYTYKCNL